LGSKNNPFYNPTTVIFDILENIPKYIDSMKLGNIIIAIGRHSNERTASRLKQKILLDKNVEIVSGISPLPTSEDVDRLVKKIKAQAADLVIGLGGGSVMDVAKAAATLCRNKGLVEEYTHHRKKIEKKGIPCITIPTTAGTGSEVTQYSSLITGKEKISLDSPFLFPTLALIDPRLTVSLPPRETAYAGMDALAQGIEATWSAKGNQISELFALETIKLVNTWLERAYLNPKDLEAREGMARASVCSGFAISSAQTTAPHSISYPLTVFFDVPHGIAVSLTLTAFMRWNEKEVPNKLALISRALDSDDVDGAVRRVEAIAKKIGLPRRLRELGLSKSDIEVILEHGFRPDRIRNNPRKVTMDEMKIILESVY